MAYHPEINVLLALQAQQNRCRQGYPLWEKGIQTFYHLLNIRRLEKKKKKLKMMTRSLICKKLYTFIIYYIYIYKGLRSKSQERKFSGEVWIRRAFHMPVLMQSALQLDVPNL